MGKVLLLFLTGLVALVAWAFYGPLAHTEAPVLPDFFWGPKSKEGQKEDTTIRPFSIKVDEKVLTDLKTRLKLETSVDGNRLLPPLEGIGFQYGFNSNFLKKVTTHWLNKYDWKAREALLNKYPQFKTTVSGIDIHFQHVKPDASVSKKYKETRPLLLLHGWPGSIVELQKVIPLLTEPKDSDINFELIVPSLPGYGFSERAHRPGLGQVEAAQLFLKLMTRLGHGNQFYVQGGDWGSLIASNMASLYPTKIAGVHMNPCMSMHSRTHLRILLAAIYPSLFVDEDEISKTYPVSSVLATLMEESGYMHLQSTKPDTLGAGLSNSPTGLAAYILEKFSSWTNLNWRNKEDGGLVPYFNLDELLDNVMVYWVTNTITSSVRFYSESFNRRTLAYQLDNVPVQVPTGCLVTPNEMWDTQAKFHILEKFPNLLSHTKVSKGGHFPAFEVPQIFAKDVVDFFNLVERNTTVSFPKNKKL